MKYLLHKLRLNSGGYDEHGRYFGNLPGTAVYEYEDEHFIAGTVRAVDRDHAKRQVLAQFPQATFYR